MKDIKKERMAYNKPYKKITYILHVGFHATFSSIS